MTHTCHQLVQRNRTNGDDTSFQEEQTVSRCRHVLDQPLPPSTSNGDQAGLQEAPLSGRACSALVCGLGLSDAEAGSGLQETGGVCLVLEISPSLAVSPE